MCCGQEVCKRNLDDDPLSTAHPLAVDTQNIMSKIHIGSAIASNSATCQCLNQLEVEYKLQVVARTGSRSNYVDRPTSFQKSIQVWLCTSLRMMPT
jgi:hypothetical protein